MKNLKSFLIGIVASSALLIAGTAHADLIKRSTDYNRTVLIVDSADHVTGKTGLAAGLTIKISKAGGTLTTITPTVTELGGGKYNIALTSSHTDTLAGLDLQITASGADPTDTHDQVVAFDPGDASLLGLTGVATKATQDAMNVKLGTPTGASISADIAGLPTAAQIATATWAAGTRTITGTVSLSANDELTLGRLFTMTNSTPAFTTAALANAPTGSGGGSGLSTEQDATLTAIKAKTDLLTFDGSGYVNARVKAMDTAVNDAVVTALLASVIDGTKTFKQVQAIMLSMAGGNYTTTVNTTTKVATVNYKNQAGVTLTSAVVTDYNSTSAPNRTVTFSNLP